MFQYLEFKEQKSEFTITFCKQPLISINKNGLKSVIEKMPLILNYLNGLNGMGDQIEEAKKELGIDNLIKTYMTMRATYYGQSKSVISVSKSSKEYGHFVKALRIIENLETTPEIYINAQIDGLKFLSELDGKKHHFPSPTQLCTAKAEERLFEYLNKSKVAKPKIVLNDKDKYTPALQNNKFVIYRNKMKEGKASLEEACYLEAVLLHRKGKVPNIITDYINKLLKE
jgi:hypothetical protein